MNDDVIRRSDVKKAIFSKPAYHGSDGSWYHSDDIRDAVDSTPSADTFEITKEALIEAIDNAETVGDVVENIIDRPREWIPCSERLPSNSDDVLITIKGNDFVSSGAYAGYYSNRWWYMCEDGEVTDVPILADVIAWMPLPKPWKGADDGNK